MKDKLLLVFLVINLLIFPQSVQCSFADSSNEIKVSAKSAIAVELNSDQIVFQKVVNAKRPIASTTKVMTALVALDKLPLSKVLTTTPEAASAGEAEIYLEPDETMTVENLLYAMLLRSANDASMVLAEGASKTSSKFTELMNKKAKSLGAFNTNFTNPHGLYNKKHYSTAYDLYLITREALKNPVFARIVATRKKVLPRNGRSLPRIITNHNKLVLKYDYIKGVKTGYTSEAGYCLIALGKLNNLKILTVVLGAPTSQDCYRDTLNLINHIALNYTYQNFVKKGEVVGKLYLENGSAPLIAQAEEGLSIFYSKKDLVITNVTFNSNNYLPIKKGSVVGSFKVLNKKNKKVLGEVRLVARNDVKPAKIFYSPESLLSQAFRFLSKILNFF